ncbi:UbiA family prenyltransferase [uncultured Caballeronia sp.]|jgi:4-hydroxybenzoate polyprenyltransferase|uniref:UbiA family prenyltransferase n=1 Tax=uncultured Caballeronia sp. TaxID=1827198 RepID=UPI0015759D04
MRKNPLSLELNTPYYLKGALGADGASSLTGSGTGTDLDSVRLDAENIALCVDLDHTFTDTDLLLESFLLLIKKNPLYVFMCFFWLLKSKAWLKTQIASRVVMDVAVLPYNTALLAYLRDEKAHGRNLYLCTAANWTLAQAIADHFGIFTGVMASTNVLNLSGSKKANALVSQFGVRGFDYCGDAMVDVPVWKQSRRAIVVGHKKIAAAAGKVNDSIVFFEKKSELLKLIVKEMRVYQWVKNLLIFVPLLAAHRFTSVDPLMAAGIAFASFSLCASSVYLLNDLLDLDADRRHARKRNRPFASGKLPVSLGLGLSLALMMGSAALAALLPPKFAFVLGAYFAATLAYSFFLKRHILIDVFTLAALYTARIFAGGAADDIVLSYWLVLFSGLLFLSLAMVKRYTELDALVRSGSTAGSAAGRGYLAQDIMILCAFGTASAYAAVLVLALYMNSPEITALYTRKPALWLLFGLLLYWISRVWMLAFRGQMNDDPIVFAVKDRTSLLVISLCVLSVMLAI